jgi:hypothetical protein
VPLPARRPRHRHRGSEYSTPPEILGYPIPDPAEWPADIRDWFTEATSRWAEGANDIFVFHCGDHCQIVLTDAISVVGMVGAIRIDESEWHTEKGWPAFCFDVARLDDVKRVMESAGYKVKVLISEQVLSEQEPRRTTAERRVVVSIAEARCRQRSRKESL